MTPTQTKRHCMVVHAYYPLGETRVQREALALRDRGWDVHVICLRDRGEPAHDEEQGITIRRVSVRRHRGRGFLMQFLEYLMFFVLAGVALTFSHLRRRFDVVQVHNLPDFLVFAAIAAKATGTPIVLDLHDLMPEFFAARTQSRLDSPVVRLVTLQERWACRFADHVITVTDDWRRTLIDRGVSPDKVSVVMNVADSKVFRPRRQKRNDADPRRFEVLYHGTFTHRYGVDLIVDAIHILADELPSLRARLLGDGDSRSDLVDMVRARDLEDRITISDGMVGVEHLPAALARADVGVVPNRSNVFTDGILPTKLLEYVAVGVPVVASRTPGVEAYFSDDQIAFFAPGDAKDLAQCIRGLHDDPIRCRTLAQEAAVFNETMSWDRVATEYVDTVSRLSARTHHDSVVATSREAHDDGVTVSASDSAADTAWDEFLARSPQGHHTQTAAWARVKATTGWRSVRVVAYRGGEVVGGAQVLHRALPVNGSIGYVSKGPVVTGEDQEAATAVMQELAAICRSLGIHLLTIQPPGWEPEPPSWVVGREFVPSSTEVAPRATMLVDVGKDLDEILAAMGRKTRYNVRLSRRRGVAVREGDVGDLATYHGMLQATASRQGFEAPPLEYLLEMWDVLHPLGHIRLALAEIDDEPLAGQIAIPFGTTVVNKLSVWSGAHGNLRPNEAVQWNAIEWAHDQGFATYDLEGVRTSAALQLQRGEGIPDSQRQSVTSFKIGFGGDIVIGPSAQVFVPNPVLRWGFREFSTRFAHQRWARRTVKRIRTWRSDDPDGRGLDDDD